MLVLVLLLLWVLDVAFDTPLLPLLMPLPLPLPPTEVEVEGVALALTLTLTPSVGVGRDDAIVQAALIVRAL